MRRQRKSPKRKGFGRHTIWTTVKINDLGKPKARTVLGVDSSTQGIGFCVFYNRKPVAWGKISLRGNDIHERCGDAQKKMRGLIEKFDIDVMAIEQVVFVQNRAVVIKLAYLCGNVIGVAASKGIKVFEVAPMSWMNYIGNKKFTPKERADFKQANPGRKKSWYQNELRKQRKQRTIDYMHHRYGVTVVDDDVADAIGVAMFTYNRLTRRK